MSNAELKNDGERMVPEFHKGGLIYAEHLLRYEAAVDFAKGKVVLDIASGSGYGTQLLSKHAKKVYGIDVSQEAVDYSNQYFPGENIEYIVGDAEVIPLEDESVDLVVTFETIEHVKNYKLFLTEIKRILRPGGVVIVSTPNDLEFAEGNHFHLHEFQYEELLDLLKDFYKHIHSYYQATWKSVAIGEVDFLSGQKDSTITVQNLAPVQPSQYLYFYLVCSDEEIKNQIKPAVAFGAHYSDRQQHFEDLKMDRLSKEIEVKNNQIDHITKDINAKNLEISNLSARIQAIERTLMYRSYRKIKRIAHYKTKSIKKNNP